MPLFYAMGIPRPTGGSMDFQRLRPRLELLEPHYEPVAVWHVFAA